MSNKEFENLPRLGYFGKFCPLKVNFVETFSLVYFFFFLLLLLGIYFFLTMIKVP